MYCLLAINSLQVKLKQNHPSLHSSFSLTFLIHFHSIIINYLSYYNIIYILATLLLCHRHLPPPYSSTILLPGSLSFSLTVIHFDFAILTDSYFPSLVVLITTTLLAWFLFQVRSSISFFTIFHYVSYNNSNVSKNAYSILCIIIIIQLFYY
jgi:hypothetical protein